MASWSEAHTGPESEGRSTGPPREPGKGGPVGTVTKGQGQTPLGGAQQGGRQPKRTATWQLTPYQELVWVFDFVTVPWWYQNTGTGCHVTPWDVRPWLEVFRTRRDQVLSDLV